MDIHHIQNMIADIERQEEKMREFEREISLAKTAVRNIATPVLQTAGWKPMWVEGECGDDSETTYKECYYFHPDVVVSDLVKEIGTTYLYLNGSYTRNIFEDWFSTIPKEMYVKLY